MPIASHPEAVAAEIRRKIVCREEQSWSEFGFDEVEARVWQEAGIPAGKPQLAAICRRAPELGGSELNPADLQMRLHGGETVLNSLLHGTNALRLIERIDAARGLRRRIPTSYGLALGVGKFPLSVPSARHALRSCEKDPDPRKLPAVLDGVAELITREYRAREPRRTLMADARSYLDGAAPSQLLLDCAKAFGVYGDSEALRTLAPVIAASGSEVDRAWGVAQIFDACSRDRHLFFATAESARLIRDASTDMTTEVPIHATDLPSASGMLWLTGDNTASTKVLAWNSTLDGTLRASLVSGKRLLLRATSRDVNHTAKHTTAIVRMSEFGSGKNPILDERFDERHRSLQTLLAFVHLSRAARENSPPGSTAIGKTPNRDEVVVVSLKPDGQPRALPAELPVRSRNVQWRVRGHWRRQWYPSANEHRLLWIQEHMSGPSDAPVLFHERISVVRT
ncbi:hypothetical protein FB385_3129 [Paramicrobacterium agarici]|nr:hypothetical protein FB385_3129 [Microbacterium agarici]